MTTRSTDPPLNHLWELLSEVGSGLELLSAEDQFGEECMEQLQYIVQM